MSAPGHHLPAAYLPADGRPVRVSIGTRPMDLRDWIEIDHLRVVELDHKDELLRERHDEVVATMPRGDDGSQEVLELLVEHLLARFPDVYARDGHSRAAIVDRQRDVTVALDSGHPIDVAGRLVQEDLCLMSHVDGAWILTAASLCFPSRWRLSDKIGRDLRAIHGPVPFYEERIGAPVDTAFDRLRPETPVWRINWTILDDPELFQPDSATRREPHELVGDFGTALHVRVERQTLRALPRSGDVLFTIRTYTCPLGEAESLRPGALAQLADTLEATAQPTTDYKGWAGWRDAVVAWARSERSPSG